MSEPAVDVIVEEPGWKHALPDLELVAEQALQLVLTSAALDADRYSVCLLACDDARIAELNESFRGKPVPTNVLSWPAFDLAPQMPGERPRRPPMSADGDSTALGDVAIALQTIAREAESAAIPLKNHTLHLIVHGCLHLLGYDHADEADADMMEGIERRALSGAGIPDPYV